MADRPTLQIDDDWKRQAQEEKRRLAEQDKARTEAAASAASAKPAAGPSAPGSERGSERGGKSRELPTASFSTLVQSMLTQADYYLGAYAGQDGEPMIDLDGAKLQIDLLSVLETKAKGNLDTGEQTVLDSALYELRSRYVSIATQMIR